jgi:hypothetical protein
MGGMMVHMPSLETSFPAAQPKAVTPRHWQRKSSEVSSVITCLSLIKGGFPLASEILKHLMQTID